ncbi:hypothetical protein AGMMS50276_31800 [Synergistales bacterium]|nr:hypothetical protein AGMMS50276_31800 [Synergistales bacterium]
MKDKLITQLKDVWDEMTYGLRWLCLCPSPAKRLVTVLILILVCGGLNIWFVVSSIYNTGKNDARKEFLELQHIESLKLLQKNDSINYELKIKSKEYEYE